MNQVTEYKILTNLRGKADSHAFLFLKADYSITVSTKFDS